MDTKGNEVSPIHRQNHKFLATCEYSKAMGEGVEERAKSERPSVMDGIGALPRSESWLTCSRCDSVKPLRL